MLTNCLAILSAQSEMSRMQYPRNRPTQPAKTTILLFTILLKAVWKIIIFIT
jgi:hypothetical protein